MKKIAVAICLCGTVASSNAMQDDDYVSSSAVCETFSNAEYDYLTVDKKVLLEKQIQESKDKTIALQSILDQMSKTSFDSETIEKTKELALKAQECYGILALTNALQLHQGPLVQGLDILGKLRDKGALMKFLEFNHEIRRLGISLVSKGYYGDEYSIVNGMIGMNRDIILRLLWVVGQDPQKVRAIMGMCLVHFNWRTHQLFKRDRAIHQWLAQAFNILDGRLDTLCEPSFYNRQSVLTKNCPLVHVIRLAVGMASHTAPFVEDPIKPGTVSRETYALVHRDVVLFSTLRKIYSWVYNRIQRQEQQKPQSIVMRDVYIALIMVTDTMLRMSGGYPYLYQTQKLVLECLPPAEENISDAISAWRETTSY